MRILWLSHFIPYPLTGGARLRTFNLLAQASARHEVHVLAFNQSANLPSPNAVADALAALRPHVASVDVLPIPAETSNWRRRQMTIAAFGKKTPYDVNWLASSEMHRRVRALASRESFDLVHLDTLGLVQYLADVPTLPAALNHHNIESQLTQRRAALERHPLRAMYLARDGAKLEALERLVCPSVGVNMVVSPLDGDRLAKIAPGARTVVVDNGVDTEYFRPNASIASDPHHLVFAGGMNWFPNREAIRYFARDIWPALIRENPNRRATIIGREPPRELLDAADERLVVTGFVDDVRPHIHRAGIYVCPIRNGGGTRLKILDALAMGKPLVATELAVEGLFMEPEVHYLRAETPPDYVLQVKRLEENEELRCRLSAAGRRLVEERYAWSVIGHSLASAYDVAIAHAFNARSADVGAVA